MCLHTKFSSCVSIQNCFWTILKFVAEEKKNLLKNFQTVSIQFIPKVCL